MQSLIHDVSSLSEELKFIGYSREQVKALIDRVNSELRSNPDYQIEMDDIGVKKRTLQFNAFPQSYIDYLLVAGKWVPWLTFTEAYVDEDFSWSEQFESMVELQKVANEQIFEMTIFEGKTWFGVVGEGPIVYMCNADGDNESIYHFNYQTRGDGSLPAVEELYSLSEWLFRDVWSGCYRLNKYYPERWELEPILNKYRAVLKQHKHEIKVYKWDNSGNLVLQPPKT